MDGYFTHLLEQCDWSAPSQCWLTSESQHHWCSNNQQLVVAIVTYFAWSYTYSVGTVCATYVQCRYSMHTYSVGTVCAKYIQCRYSTCYIQCRYSMHTYSVGTVCATYIQCRYSTCYIQCRYSMCYIQCRYSMCYIHTVYIGTAHLQSFHVLYEECKVKQNKLSHYTFHSGISTSSPLPSPPSSPLPLPLNGLVWALRMS